MLDQRDLLTIAEGAAGAAQAYILECLAVDPPGRPGEVAPISDEQMQSMLMALAFTVVLLETTIKVNVRNPDTRAAIRAMLEGVADKIAEKAIDKLAAGPDNSPGKSIIT